MAEAGSRLSRSRVHRALSRPNLLMGADRFAALAALPDTYLANCFGVPPEQVPTRRAELGLETLNGGADRRPP